MANNYLSDAEWGKLQTQTGLINPDSNDPYKYGIVKGSATSTSPSLKVNSNEQFDTNNDGTLGNKGDTGVATATFGGNQTNTSLNQGGSNTGWRWGSELLSTDTPDYMSLRNQQVADALISNNTTSPTHVFSSLMKFPGFANAPETDQQNTYKNIMGLVRDSSPTKASSGSMDWDTYFSPKKSLDNSKINTITYTDSDGVKQTGYIQ